jgi:hypothetical protein
MTTQYLKNLENLPEELTPELETLKMLAPAIWNSGFRFLTIKDGKLSEALKEPTESSSSETALRVELSEDMLTYLKDYKPVKSKAPVEELYMIDSAPFSVFIKTTVDPSVDCTLMGLSKVIDTKDPVSMEELSFVDASFWKRIYNELRLVCVDVCPRGHVISFETLCSFMADDGWSHDEAGNITKVKCPCCRLRFRVHDTIPLLCNFFTPIISADKLNTDKDRKSKDDNIDTYFSTEDDEDESVNDIRTMLRLELARGGENDDEDDEEDENYVDEEEDDEDEEDEGEVGDETSED